MRNLALVLLLLTSGLAWAEEPELGPLIEGYGPTYLISDKDVALPKDQHYKAVFDLADYAGAPESLNRSLESVARFLNMHVRNGVKPEAMDLAVVVHGAAVQSLLNNDAYRQRHGQDNPSLDLLTKLHDAGVQVYVCGQSLAFRGVAKTELAEPVQLSLSAMTMLTVLQSQGYALLPW